MKKLYVQGELTHESDLVVKTPNDIVGYSDGIEVFRYGLVNDWDAFKLEEGVEWDPDESSIDTLKATIQQQEDMINSLLIATRQQEAMIDTLLNTTRI